MGIFFLEARRRGYWHISLVHVLESKTLLMALLDFFDGNKEFESLFLIFIGWDE